MYLQENCLYMYKYAELAISKIKIAKGYDSIIRDYKRLTYTMTCFIPRAFFTYYERKNERKNERTNEQTNERANEHGSYKKET